MADWRFWKKRKAEEPKCEQHYCQCNGIKTRQATLLEFDPDMMLQKGQKKITDYIPVETTERVGMKSDKRKYRGNI